LDFKKQKLFCYGRLQALYGKKYSEGLATRGTVYNASVIKNGEALAERLFEVTRLDVHALQVDQGKPMGIRVGLKKKNLKSFGKVGNVFVKQLCCTS